MHVVEFVVVNLQLAIAESQRSLVQTYPALKMRAEQYISAQGSAQSHRERGTACARFELTFVSPADNLDAQFNIPTANPDGVSGCPRGLENSVSHEAR